METTSHSAISPDAGVADLDDQLSRVIHDINNPLAVISGNAQFLAELSGVMPLDPMILKALEDINEAVLTLNERLTQLVHLREELK